MRIFDIPRSWVSGAEPRRVAVHGSCRVHDPFESLANNGQIIKVWANNYAVSYTLAEARQMLRFSVGEKAIPSSLLPFIFDNPSNAFTIDAYSRDVIRNVDAFVVEVSELRQVRYREFFFQIQVFMRNFVLKYGSALLPWYRAFSLSKPISEEIICDALSALPHAITQEEKSLVESILREVRLEEVSIETTAQLIRQLRANGVKHWIFVSHFQVPGLAGTLMEDRGKLAEMMRRVTAECDVDFFNPTEVITHYGRQRMLANGGSDIYHYNPDHQFVVAEALIKKICLGVVNNDLPRKHVLPNKKFQPLQAIASALNALLIPFHRTRMNLLGVDDSGLHAHYAGRLDRGVIADERDIEIADLVLRYLPQFEQYHVFRAGLGEIAFLLAAFGHAIVGFDPFAGRFRAMSEGGRQLRECGVIGDNFEPRNEIVPSQESGDGTLAVATNLMMTVSPEQEESILKRLEVYEAILLDPSMLLRQRPQSADQELLLKRLSNAGFAHFQYFPQQRLLYCSKVKH